MACLKLQQLREERGWSRLNLIFKIYDYNGTQRHPNVIASVELGRKPAYSILRGELAEVFGVEEADLFPERLKAMSEENQPTDKAAAIHLP